MAHEDRSIGAAGALVQRSTQQLRQRGQSLWLDHMTHALLESGTLRRYIEEFSITGLTSNPTIFRQAIASGHEYADVPRARSLNARSPEAMFFDYALRDLTAAADLFRPIHESSAGLDGWVSLEVSPLLAHDADATLAQARELAARARRPNLMIKIPGTRAGLVAIEQAIYLGVPVNVTLLFSREHYVAAADAYLRGLERRLAAGLDPKIVSVASFFVSRWDTAVKGTVSPDLRNRLGIAVATQTYCAYRQLLAAERWQALAGAGALPQRLLWGSTGTKDPKASDTLYVEALIAPDTVNTVPESTLLAFADHGTVAESLPADGRDAENLLARFRQAGIDDIALAARLQREGIQGFIDSWISLLEATAAAIST
jgi:transaldolase